MIILGLTGSIGMGKSTTSAMFRANGVPVYDADAAVHRLYAGPAVPHVGAAFPTAVVDGRIDRAVLSQQVVHDPAALEKLETIVHPLVGQDRVRFLERCRTSASPICVLDVPLLFETGGDRSVDIIAVVSANPAEQQKRVLSRADMTREKFEAIRDKQMADAEKRRRAHVVIDTGHGLEFARRQVAALLLAIGV